MYKLRTAVLAFVWALMTLPSTAATVEDFFSAIRNNGLVRVRELSLDGSSVKLADGKGVTPLLYASAFGSVEAMRVLLEAGADVNAAESLGAVPLHWSACDPARVKLLLEHGAQVNVKNPQGRTPLMVASSCEGGADSIRMLLERGADINVQQQNGSTALLDAATYGGPSIVRLLLEAGAKANIANQQGDTPLMFAVGWGDVELVRMLIAKGVPVNARNISSGKVRHGDIAMKNLTALMFAAPFASPEMVEALLDAGANVKMQDDRGMTPLMFSVASDNQDVRVAKLLIEHGSDVNATSSTGETVLDWARKFKEPAVVALLEKAGAKYRPSPLAPERRSASLRDPKAAAAKSVSLLQRVSLQFFKESGCVGCHHQPAMALAVKAAREAGVAVDEKDFAEQRKTMAALLAPRPSRLLLGGFLDTVVNSAIGLGAAGYQADLLTDSATAAIANRQFSSGAWLESATVSRAPMQESNITRTAACIRILVLYPIAARKAEFTQRIARARAWLLEAKPRTEYERADVLLGLHWSGASADQVTRAGKVLLSGQRSDGGWSQRMHLASDPYMTGLALRALRESGQLRGGDAAYRKGVEYLLRIQMDDGSWYVRSRAVKLQPYFQSGFPYDHDQWISYAATAYATAALAGAEDAKRVRASVRSSRGSSSLDSLR
jgi:ankyrin repeat protein